MEGKDTEIIHQIESFNNESYELRNSDVPKSLQLAQEALRLSERANYLPGKAWALCHLGFANLQLAKFTEATSLLDFSNKLFIDLNLSEGQASVLYNFGVIFLRLGDMNQALNSQHKSLEIREKIKDYRGIGNCLFQIAFIQSRFNEPDLAIDSAKKAREFFLRINDKHGIAAQHMLLGMCYSEKGFKDEAVENFNESKRIRQDVNDPKGFGTLLYALGNHYLKYDQLEEAEKNLTDAVLIGNEQLDLMAIVRCNISLCEAYIKKGRYDKATASVEKGIELSKANNFKSMLPDLYKHKTIIDEKTGNFESALSSLREHIKAKDEVYNTEAGIKIKHNDILQKMASANMEAEINRLKNVELKKAYDEIADKNKEILDSINYAKRLQEAILPPKNLIEKHLPQSFILYKPKDIVAGDFYWMETTLADNYETVFIAAADCTGHGVPGALVSVVCSNALNRTVNEFGITDTGKILDKVRELVLETFQKSESEVKDGMDVSLAAIRMLENGYALVSWSGANNPLWYNSRKVFNEITADKQPVGKTETPKPFKSYSFIIEPGDILYLFTDGYADQFGGPKGKKFKYKQLEELLTKIRQLPMPEQKHILETEFNNWKGSLEQVDDVCIIGVRV